MREGREGFITHSYYSIIYHSEYQEEMTDGQNPSSPLVTIGSQHGIYSKRSK